jgi:hypothetical protein
VTSPRSNPLQVAARVAGALDDLGVKYSIGGSLASSFSGEPRSTLDVDMVVALDEASGRGWTGRIWPPVASGLASPISSRGC